MKRLAVLNVVGLSRAALGASTPNLNKFLGSGQLSTIDPALPAVTCTAQSNYLTGKLPGDHGIVANGWYHREMAEVQFWKQSNHLVHGPKIWDDLRARIPGFTCAKLFWWYNMYASVDVSITPRPMYPADGRKVFDVYTWPYEVRPAIKKELGEFPFPAFWGPAAGVDSPQFKADAVSRWIAGSAKWVEEKHKPSLSLIYLPHLDYNMQRFGPDDPRVQRDLSAIDEIVGELIGFFQQREIQVVVLSEYGITPVNRPIHLNRLFREQGWLTIKEELGLELLDCGAGKAFAVADHQLAHVYVQPGYEKAVRELLEKTPGVDHVLDQAGKEAAGLNHERAGDLVAVSDQQSWFTYYYWMDDARAPDFARCVDIHRKPGYDPVELFIDPKLRVPQLKIASKLLKKKLGFRMLMDVIPLDATLVKGSHGCRPRDQKDFPVFISAAKNGQPAQMRSVDVYWALRELMLG